MSTLNATVIGGYDTAQVLLNHMESMLFFAVVLALLFSIVDRDSRSSIRNFMGDFFVRWGLSGLFLWTILLIFWGLYEIGLQRGLFHFLPWVGIAEYGIWGVAMSGVISLLFFVASLFISAMIRAPNVTRVVYTPYSTYLEDYARYLYQYYQYQRQYYYPMTYDEEAVVAARRGQ